MVTTNIKFNVADGGERAIVFNRTFRLDLTFEQKL